LKIDEKLVKSFWDNRSKLYKKIPMESIVLFKNDKDVMLRDKLLKKLLDKHIEDRMDILDLGCGVGRICKYLSKRAKNVVGIDYSQPLIDIARKETSQKNVKYYCTNTSDFDIKNKFDVVVICGLFNYLNDDTLLKTIDGAYKHLRVGGALLIKEPLSVEIRKEIINEYSEEIGENYSSIYRTEGEIIKLLRKNDFDILSSNKIYQHRKETAIWFIVARRCIK